jgi:hypothetical protein
MGVRLMNLYHKDEVLMQLHLANESFMIYPPSRQHNKVFGHVWPSLRIMCYSYFNED